jgi:hypothetical protein
LGTANVKLFLKQKIKNERNENYIGRF